MTSGSCSVRIRERYNYTYSIIFSDACICEKREKMTIRFNLYLVDGEFIWYTCQDAIDFWKKSGSYSAVR